MRRGVGCSFQTNDPQFACIGSVCAGRAGDVLVIGEFPDIDVVLTKAVDKKGGLEQLKLLGESCFLLSRRKGMHQAGDGIQRNKRGSKEGLASRE